MAHFDTVKFIVGVRRFELVARPHRRALAPDDARWLLERHLRTDPSFATTLARWAFATRLSLGLPLDRRTLNSKIFGALQHGQASLVELDHVAPRHYSHRLLNTLHEEVSPELDESPISLPSPQTPTAAPLPQLKRRRIIDLEDVLFHTGSAVLMPDYRDCTADPFHPSADSTTGLRVLAVCLRQQDMFPQQALLVAGHTDTKGSKAGNLELSARRADNVLQALLGNREAWAASAEAHHVVEDWQQILGWVHLSFGWDCDPGRPDGVVGPRTKAALRRFRARWHELGRSELPKGHAPERPYWAAFFELMDERLADILNLQNTDELRPLRTQLRFVDNDRRAVGCGELRPRVATGDGIREAGNRRVELMFFDPGEEPQLLCHDEPGSCTAELCELDLPSVYETEYIPCNIRIPIEVLVVPGKLGTKLGMLGKTSGTYFVVGTLGEPREDVYPWRVRIAAGQPPTPVELWYRRHGEESQLCWAGDAPSLWFGNGGWLEHELYVVDGPESEPTAALVDGRLRVSGVQQGDVIIAEERKTPGKLKGRGEVHVVKNFTWNDLQRNEGKVKFWGPFDGLPDDFKVAFAEAMNFMLDQRPGRAQEQQRKAIVDLVYGPYDASTNIGGGLYKGASFRGDKGKNAVAQLNIPSALGAGMLPRDLYHFHFGVQLSRCSLSVEKLNGFRASLRKALVRIFDELKPDIDTHPAQHQGLTNLHEKAWFAQLEYVRRGASHIAAAVASTIQAGGAKFLVHSYEIDHPRYFGGGGKNMYDGDPIRNVDVEISTPPNVSLLLPKIPERGTNYQTSDWYQVAQVLCFFNSEQEAVFMWSSAPEQSSNFSTMLSGGWMQLADAIVLH